jgi:hypothetical protein
LVLSRSCQLFGSPNWAATLASDKSVSFREIIFTLKYDNVAIILNVLNKIWTNFFD